MNEPLGPLLNGGQWNNTFVNVQCGFQYDFASIFECRRQYGRNISRKKRHQHVYLLLIVFLTTAGVNI